MNNLTMHLKFQHTPTDSEKYKIEMEIKNFMSGIASIEAFDVHCGEGSWWIIVTGLVAPVAGWAALEFASWFLNKGFDYLSDRIRKAPKESNDSNIATHALVQVPEFSDEALRQFAIITQLSEFARLTGAERVALSEWSEEDNLGRIVRINVTESSLSFEFHQTDSRDEFESRMR